MQCEAIGLENKQCEHEAEVRVKFNWSAPFEYRRAFKLCKLHKSMADTCFDSLNLEYSIWELPRIQKKLNLL
jgi:hypothetical protein